MRSKIYKWHRTFSLIIAVPVLLWAASGFMHPLMTNIRPKIAAQGLPPVVIDSDRIHVPLQAALRLHHLDSISNFRLVHIDTNWFYQVQLPTHHPGNTGNANGAASTGAASQRPSFNGSASNGSVSNGSASSGSASASPAFTSPSAGRPGAAIPIYLSCTNGNVLPAGDWLYAQYLARQFLEGPANLPASAHNRHPGTPKPGTGLSGTSSISGASSAPGIPSAPNAMAIVYTAPAAHDCCGAATETVLNPVKGTKVANVSLLKEYDMEYKSINKLLPVYRVSFERPDGIRVYVETTRDRFAFAMDNRRMVFDRIFTLVHTWAWLDFLGKGKGVIEGILVSMAFLTALMGIYIFFATKAKKANGNELMRARRTHRYTSISIALFTLMFTFSGALHVVSKFWEDTRDRFFVAPSFATTDCNFHFSQLQEAVKDPITDISIVSMYGHAYWQITTLPVAKPPAAGLPATASSSTARPATSSSPPQPSSARSSAAQPPSAAPSSTGMASAASHAPDLMKDAQVQLPSRTYVRTDSPYSILLQGEMEYAGFLASTFSGQPSTAFRTTTPVLRFSSEYNFADKRLPVWRVSYASPGNERYYVETSTGRLSKRVTNSSLIEEYSFAFLHKHEFMGWGGKTVKDSSTMFWAMAQIVMVCVGLMLYVKYHRHSSSRRYS